MLTRIERTERKERKEKIRAKLLLSIVSLLLTLATALPVMSQQLNWSASIGGRSNDRGASTKLLNDGGYIVVGSTYSFGSGDYDIYLLRLDDYGDTLWAATFGASGTELGYDVVQTNDNGFLIVGSTTSFGNGSRDCYLVKTDSNGSLLWTKTYGGPSHDELVSIAPCPDSGFVLAGTSESYGPGYSDIYLMRINETGDTLWSQAYGGAGGDNGKSIKRTFDNSYIVVGSTGSFGVGYSSIYAIKFDEMGDTLWTKTYGGPKADFGRTVDIAQDGGFVIGGRTHSFGAGYGDAYLVKTDSDGIFQWENYFGGSYEDNVFDICPSVDGGYLLAGTTESFGSGGLDIYLIKTDLFGQEVWSRTYGGTEADYAYSVVQNGNYDFFIAGHSYSDGAGGSDLYLFEITGDSPTDVIEWATDPLLPESITLGQNYPNPFNATTIIPLALNQPANLKITLYNILGQAVKEWGNSYFPAGEHKLLWDGRNDYGQTVTTGIYLFRVSDESISQTRKLVLVK